MNDNAKHTPGPWTAYTFEPEKNKEHYVRAGEYQQIPICRTGRWDSASAADAELIAQAPEMLRVLDSMMERLTGNWGDQVHEGQIGVLMDEVDIVDAIAILEKLHVR